jgi:hypothetical protein
MSAIRAMVLGGGSGGGCGGVVGGGIAQFVSGPDTPLLLLWMTAFISATVGGLFSAVVIHANRRAQPPDIRQ